MGVEIPYEVFQDRLAKREAMVLPEDLALEERGQLIPLFGSEEEPPVEVAPQRSMRRPRGVPHGINVIKEVQDRMCRDTQASKWGQWRRAHLEVDHGDLEERDLSGGGSHLCLAYSAPMGRAFADCLLSPVEQGVLMQGLSGRKGDCKNLVDEVNQRALWGTWEANSISMAEDAARVLEGQEARVRDQVVAWLREMGAYHQQKELERQAYMAYAEAAS